LFTEFNGLGVGKQDSLEPTSALLAQQELYLI